LNLARSGFLANADRRNAFCDWCGGRIGGARLFCLDCVIKGTESHNTVDLCCAPECATARITHRQDIEAPHEPNHRLVKARTTVLTRQHGRAYTAAQKAFTQVENVCKRIAEASQQAQEKEEQTVPDAETALSPEDVPSETPPEDNKPENGPDVPEDTKSGAEGAEDTPQEQEQETPQNAEQAPAPAQDSDLPSCGKCKGPLSFPCWYCVKCEGQLSSDALLYLGVLLLKPFYQTTFSYARRAKETTCVLS